MACLWARGAACALLAVASSAPQPAGGGSRPAAEVLNFNVEWRLIHAGHARLTWAPTQSAPQEGWSANLHLESGGLVSRLFKVNNDYSSLATRDLCIVSSLLNVNEGNRRRETKVTFDAARGKAVLTDRDLVKNAVATNEIDIRPCEHDVIGALYRLRAMRMEPGSSAEVPVSDGKRAVVARVEAQERETLKTDAGTFKTIRYEAFLFNNVLYRRRGRLFVWLTDDERRVPVQIRVRLPFYVGTITLQLEKEGKG